MKALKLLSLLTVISMLCNGCLLTLYPIYTQNDVVYDSALLGTYQSQHGDHPPGLEITNLADQTVTVTTTIAAMARSGYYMRYTDREGNAVAEYAAFVVILSGETYIDLFPLKGKFGSDAFYKTMTIPMHSIYQVDLDSNGLLTLLPLDQGYLEQCIQNKDIRYESNRSEQDEVFRIITAGTLDLQRYVSQYGHDPDAYEPKEKEIYKKLRS